MWRNLAIHFILMVILGSARSLRWQFWMSTIGRSGSIIQFLSFCVGVDYDRWSLSVSLSGVITNTGIQRQWLVNCEEGSIYTPFWLPSNERKVTRPHFSVIYAITSPYFRKSMKWVLIWFFDLTFPFICNLLRGNRVPNLSLFFVSKSK